MAVNEHMMRRLSINALEREIDNRKQKIIEFQNRGTRAREEEYHVKEGRKENRIFE